MDTHRRHGRLQEQIGGLPHASSAALRSWWNLSYRWKMPLCLVTVESLGLLPRSLWTILKGLEIWKRQALCLSVAQPLAEVDQRLLRAMIFDYMVMRISLVSDSWSFSEAFSESSKSANIERSSFVLCRLILRRGLRLMSIHILHLLGCILVQEVCGRLLLGMAQI